MPQLRHAVAAAGHSRRLPALHALPPHLQQLVREWLELDRDPTSRAAIRGLREREEGQELEALLGQRLAFGTAGLRGLMGPGYARMNAVTVQQTAQGVVDYLLRTDAARAKAGGVVIGERGRGVEFRTVCPSARPRRGAQVVPLHAPTAPGYDGRHCSRAFAELAAAVVASAGLPVHLFSELVPTPLVAVGIGVLGCAAGVMVTASHNPKDYNGIKVYLGDGCQIIPPHDAGIAAAIARQRTLWALGGVEDAPYGHALVTDPLARVESAYYSRLVAELRFREPAANGAAPAVAYTPLHGVGAPWVARAFREFGLPPPVAVAAQAAPDPDFSTVDFPNPEEGEGAWRLAYEAAERAGAAVAMANDPDADRFCVTERDPATGRWRAYTGNEIGAMLADWVLTNRARRAGGGGGGASMCVLSSAVSSHMLARIAERQGAHWEETLTGFKWLGHRGLELEEAG